MNLGMNRARARAIAYVVEIWAVFERLYSLVVVTTEKSARQKKREGKDENVSFNQDKQNLLEFFHSIQMNATHTSIDYAIMW